MPTNFLSAPANQFEASNSRAPMSNRNDEPIISSSSYFVEEPRYGNGTGNTRRIRTNSYHNCARSCYPSRDVCRLELPPPTICSYCRAKLFRRETHILCCKGGKVDIPEIPVPTQLLNLFTDDSAEGRIFRQNVRAYNHVFSFTSMGVALDENLPAFNQGIYTFRAHGLIYHMIGTLLPPPDMRPRYLQIFIYDTDNELEHRLQESGGLDPELIKKIRQILDAHNPFVKIFRQLAQRADIHDCRLLIREKPGTHLQYTLPTSSQVAAILVGGEELMEASDRDIIVQSWRNVGRRIILPSSFTGSPRDMYQRYQDAMAIVQKFGKPDIFLTMTCNPSWKEIKDQLLPGQTPQDRPDLLTRIFRAKYEELKEDIFHKGVLGKTIAHVHMASLIKKMAKEEHNPKVELECYGGELSPMIEDYPSSNVNSLYIMNKLLHDITDILQQHKRSIKEFDLPQISEGFEDMRAISGLIEHELSIPISDDDLYGSRVLNADYMENRAIITPLNDDVNKLNEKAINAFPGEEVTYYSFDSVPDDTRNLYLPEFLNSISPGNLPPHKLVLKKGSPIMLLRNIDPKIGLCNGTGLICRRFGRNLIEAEILAG
ncbi:UNVERIFIED_CONTAM: hypothetical protein Sradi_5535100 [Sesamum radiatum]|uniref:ATP-dependent DNA helicase n=1 Tax=Sesamum radiatum TaxID=300843 RepID=A0AAW2LDR3_SESRA